jgi:hypothetical protein
MKPSPTRSLLNLALLLVVGSSIWPTYASAQEVADPVVAANRAGDDLDYARKREADLAARAAEQERANERLREQLKAAGGNLQNDELVKASADAAALRKKLSEIRARRDAARKKLDLEREKALDNFEATDQVTAARSAAEQAAAEVERLSAPILEQLQQNPHHQEAQAMVDAAAQAGERLQDFGPLVNEQMLAQADAAFEAALARVREIEDAATSADPKVAEAKKSLAVAEETLAGLRQEFERTLNDVAGVAGARLDFDAAQRDFDDLTTKLAAAEKHLSALRQARGVAPNDPAANPNDPAIALAEGEARLRDLHDQLDQARVAREDAEDRLRYADEVLAASRRRVEFEPLPAGGSGGFREPYYEPLGPAYDWGYTYSAPVYYPAYTYYYPTTIWIGTGFFFGHHHHYHRHHRFHDHWYWHRYHTRHHHHHHHHDTFNHRDRHRGDHWAYSSPGRWERDPRSGNWRYDRDRRDDTNRREIDRRDGTRTGRSEAWVRNRGARDNLNAARQSVADAGRDYRYRTGSNYRGGERASLSSPTVTRLRQQDTTDRVRRYEEELRQRRTGGTDPRTTAALRDAGGTRGAIPEIRNRPTFRLDDADARRRTPTADQPRVATPGSRPPRSVPIDNDDIRSRTRTPDTNTGRSGGTRDNSGKPDLSPPPPEPNRGLINPPRQNTRPGPRDSVTPTPPRIETPRQTPRQTTPTPTPRRPTAPTDDIDSRRSRAAEQTRRADESSRGDFDRRAESARQSRSADDSARRAAEASRAIESSRAAERAASANRAAAERSAASDRAARAAQAERPMQSERAARAADSARASEAVRRSAEESSRRSAESSRPSPPPSESRSSRSSSSNDDSPGRGGGGGGGGGGGSGGRGRR